MKNKLILVEGIPGSGKSTAVANLQKFLENKDTPSRFWHEGDFDHPADFEGVARLSKPQGDACPSQY
jgi:uridine kinase